MQLIFLNVIILKTITGRILFRRCSSRWLGRRIYFNCLRKRTCIWQSLRSIRPNVCLSYKKYWKIWQWRTTVFCRACFNSIYDCFVTIVHEIFTCYYEHSWNYKIFIRENQYFYRFGGFTAQIPKPYWTRIQTHV